MTYKDIEGYCDYHWFYDRVFKTLTDGAVIAEVGVYFGHSVAYMATLAKRYGKNIKIYAIDTFDGSPEHKKKLQGRDMYAEFMKNMQLCGVYDIVEPLRCDSSDGARYFNDFIDFAFLDAEHSYEAVKVDIDAWLPVIKPAGMIAGHDYTKAWPGVVKAVDELLPERQVIKNVWYYEQ